MISRRKDNPSKPEGRDFLEEYERDAVKDVVLLGSNEVVEVLAKFAPFPGVYVRLFFFRRKTPTDNFRCSTATTASILTKV